MKSVYFVSNNKKPNLKFWMSKELPVYTNRSTARKALKAVKAVVATPKSYKIFKVSVTATR